MMVLSPGEPGVPEPLPTAEAAPVVSSVTIADIAVKGEIMWVDGSLPTPAELAPRLDAPITRGASGEAVSWLQKRLNELSFWAGEGDGQFGEATWHAVMAYQKHFGLPRNGIVSPEMMPQIAEAERPTLPDRGIADYTEADLAKQVVYEVRDGQVAFTTSISSGNGKRYCEGGSCGVAVTPRGEFKILRKINGLRVSRLGELYHPSYFKGGFAFHGSRSVPGYPASHGCIRLPMTHYLDFFNRNPVGMAVFIHD